MLFGLAAGFILNLMPCVLPVLALKMSALLTLDADEERLRKQRFRGHNLFFAAGILSFFIALAMFTSALGLAWGQLFQQPYAVLTKLLFVFALSLSLFNLITLPVIDLKSLRTASNNGNSLMYSYGARPEQRSLTATARQTEPLRAYIAGLTATLLATPCSGPLLGGVLAWIMFKPAGVILIVFISTGLGMALPYLCFAAFPQSVSLLPKPGSWLAVLEKGVAVFLLGTVVYLTSILPAHMAKTLAILLPALLALLILRLAKKIRKTPPILPVLIYPALLAALLFFAALPAKRSAQWVDFDPASFEAQLSNTAMLVQFTADWCPNCKALEHTVLRDSNMAALAEKHSLTLVRADLTRPAPDAQNLLRSLGSISIPLTAIFPKGEQAYSPLILRDIYTLSQLKAALEQF
jgi:thiol:disulfide interchange protein DsbD